MTQIRYS